MCTERKKTLVCFHRTSVAQSPSPSIVLNTLNPIVYIYHIPATCSCLSPSVGTKFAWTVAVFEIIYQHLLEINYYSFGSVFNSICMRYLWVWNHVSVRLINSRRIRYRSNNRTATRKGERDGQGRGQTQLCRQEVYWASPSPGYALSLAEQTLWFHKHTPPSPPFWPLLMHAPRPAVLATSVIGTLFNCLCFRFSIFWFQFRFRFCFEFFGHAMWANKTSLISPNMHESCPKLETLTCSGTEDCAVRTGAGRTFSTSKGMGHTAS